MTDKTPGPSSPLDGMTPALAVFQREFTAYFATPLAYVFLVVFLFAAGIFTFYIGNFFEAGQADLKPFFNYQPWLYLFLVPAIGMRLWAEERRTGTVELLLTLPVPIWAAVLGKYFAAWAFIGLALLCTTPIWMTVNLLGNPDNGVIIAAYIGSFLMAGAYLAVSAAISAMTQNQVIAFVLAVTVCFIFMLSGVPIILDFFQGWSPQFLTDLIAGLSFLAHFDAIAKGVLDLRDILFFITFIALWLFVNYMAIDLRKAG